MCITQSKHRTKDETAANDKRDDTLHVDVECVITYVMVIPLLFLFLLLLLLLQ